MDPPAGAAWTRAAATERSLWWSRRAVEMLSMGTCVEQLMEDGPCRAMLEQYLESCRLREAHMFSVWEGWHPIGWTPCGKQAESDHKEAAETKCYEVTAATIFCFFASLEWRR